jgi:hypothetical protein
MGVLSYDSKKNALFFFFFVSLYCSHGKGGWISVFLALRRTGCFIVGL